MRAVRLFVDSNVVLYARDLSLTDKAGTVTEWLRQAVAQDVACANLQVLNEVANVMLRKRQDLSPDEIFAAVDELGFLGCSSIDEHHAMHAREIRKKTRYSWWDCLLLASALGLGCTHFLSEDLQDGQVIEGSTTMGLTIVDPFAHTPEQILASL